MQRTRSHSAEILRPQQPVACNAASAELADVNQLGIRILALKSLSLKEDTRLKALLDCASKLERMPQRFLPLLVGELVDACATLPSSHEIRALEAMFEFQKPRAPSA